MNSINSVDNTALAQSEAGNASNSMAGLASEDFLKLLLAQLSNQDPLEPMGNQELLEQISLIRDIEMSTELTSTLKKMTGQQHFAAASAMIGQYVSGPTGDDGSRIGGVVAGCRFESDGRAILMLDNGKELPLDQVVTVESMEKVGQALIGKTAHGIDRRDPANLEEIEGVITAVRIGEHGEVLLELDTGEDLPLADVVRIDTQVSDTGLGEKIASGAAKALKGILGI